MNMKKGNEQEWKYFTQIKHKKFWIILISEKNSKVLFRNNKKFKKLFKYYKLMNLCKKIKYKRNQLREKKEWLSKKLLIQYWFLKCR